MKSSTLNTIKRFLSPITITPIIYIRAFVIFINWGLNSVIHILFLQKITFALENHNTVLFNKILIIYIGYFVFFYGFEFLMRKYGWTEVMNQVIKDIQGFYIEKYLRLDNNYTEKYGIGKSISIIEKGLDKWGELILTTIEKGSYLLVSIIFTIFMLSKTGVLYIIGFIIVLFIFYFISYYFNQKCLKFRKGRIDTRNLYTKQLVKVIMSKNEIFQSNKVENEINHLNSFVDKMTYYNKKMGFPIYGLFRLPDAIILIFLIFIFYSLGNQVLDGKLELSTLIGVSGSIIIIQKSIEIFLEFYKDITKDFIIIENLWNFFG